MPCIAGRPFWSRRTQRRLSPYRAAAGCTTGDSHEPPVGVAVAYAPRPVASPLAEATVPLLPPVVAQPAQVAPRLNRFTGPLPALGRSGAELAGIGLIATAAASAIVSGALAPVTGGFSDDWLIAPILGAPLAVLTYYRIARLTRPGRRPFDAGTTLLTAAAAVYAAAIVFAGPLGFSSLRVANAGVAAGYTICVVAGGVAAVIWTIRLLRR